MDNIYKAIADIKFEVCKLEADVAYFKRLSERLQYKIDELNESLRPKHK